MKLITFEQWLSRFRHECNRLEISSIPAHWNLKNCHAKGYNPELLAQESSFWLSYAVPAPVPVAPNS